MDVDADTDDDKSVLAAEVKVKTDSLALSAPLRAASPPPNRDGYDRGGTPDDYEE